MYINIGKKEYELKTTLGVAKRIEQHFKLGIDKILSRISEATIDEKLKILGIAAGEKADEVKTAIEDELDYSELMILINDFLLAMMFSGTDDEKEAKINAMPLDEQGKNEMRAMLKLPLKPIQAEVSIGEISSAADTE